MMVQARGPMWHKKDKERGVIPAGLRGVDKEATWCVSKADGWVYGHGTFCLVPHEVPVVGCFKWMRNSGHEAKRLWMETGRYKRQLDYVIMDAKADDAALFREFKRQRKVSLLTHCRKKMNKTSERRDMIRYMKKPLHKRYLRERGFTVEPMQAIMKDIFELDRCWMRRNENNRWLFAAMGVAVQIAQLQAYREKRSTWKIKSEVLGEP